MAISSSQIPALLLPGVRKIKGDYQDMPQQWSMIYAKGVSHMEAEKTVHVRYLPLPQLKTTGAPTQFDQNAGQRFSYNHIHIAFGLGYSFTREALKDNLYKTSFNAANLGLMRSFRQMKEIVGAATLTPGRRSIRQSAVTTCPCSRRSTRLTVTRSRTPRPRRSA